MEHEYSKKQNQNRRSIDYEFLIKLLKKVFPGGLKYPEAFQLCILLFSFSLPNLKEFALSKEELAILFTQLVKSRFIIVNQEEYAMTIKSAGVIEADINSCAHWIAVCMSVLRQGNVVIDRTIENELLSKLNNFSRVNDTLKS